MNEIVRSSGKATASLILGILSFCLTFLAGIPAMILGILALIDISKSEGKTSGQGMAITGIVTGGIGSVILLPVLVALLLPALAAAREAARKTQCANNMQRIGIALTLYEQEHGSLPPAFIADSNGTPIHSWRMLVAPYLDGAEIYDTYDFDQPWDGPANAPFDELSMSILTCPSDSDEPTTTTNYVAVRGPGFVFDDDKTVKLRNISGGASRTIAVVELAGSGIGWTEPRDITYEEFVERVQDESVSGHRGGFNVVLCDSSVRFLPYDQLDAETLRALFTLADDGGLGRPAF